MKNFSEKFKAQLNKKKEADSKTVTVKEIKKQLSSKNIKGKVVLLVPNEIKLRDNIRDLYEYEQIESLARDILSNGQLEPVVITSDNYLLWGYRRFKAIEMIISKPEFLKNLNLKSSALNKFNKLVCYQINKESRDISDEELQELQFAENNERRDIDNFQLSKIYNSYLKKGYSQSEICKKFSKSKAYVSAIISLKNIDELIIRYIKEFQVYGCSKEKFIAINSKSMGDVEKSTLQINNELKKIVGWQPLYNISKGENLLEQKKLFLSLYKSNLTKEEIERDFDTIQKPEIDNKSIMVKKINKFIKDIDSIKEILPKDSDLFSKLVTNIDEILVYLDS